MIGSTDNTYWTFSNMLNQWTRLWGDYGLRARWEDDGTCSWRVRHSPDDEWITVAYGEADSEEDAMKKADEALSQIVNGVDR